MNEPTITQATGRWLGSHDTATGQRVYAYCRGAAPNGTPRLIPMRRPPYGKTVYICTRGTNNWRTERLPFRPHPAAVAVTLLGLLAAWGMHQLLEDPVHVHKRGPLTFATVAVFAALACAVQALAIRPLDSIASAKLAQFIVEEAERTRIAGEHYRAQQQALQAQDQALRVQVAMAWQMAAIHHHLHPKGGSWPPYMQ